MFKNSSKITLPLKLVIIPLIVSTMLTSCASAQQQESTGQYVDSSVITAKVKAKLLADNAVKSLPITVKTYKSTVQLSGFVNDESQEERAVSLARSVPGVTGVQDSLIIKNK